MTPTNGKPPRGAGPWMVKFRSGFVSGPYARDQLQWADSGHAFDVVEVAACDSKGEQKTWNPKAGGY